MRVFTAGVGVTVDDGAELLLEVGDAAAEENLIVVVDGPGGASEPAPPPHRASGSQALNPVAVHADALVAAWLEGPPLHPPGSLAAGSATEKRSIDIWHETIVADLATLEALIDQAEREGRDTGIDHARLRKLLAVIDAGRSATG